MNRLGAFESVIKRNDFWFIIRFKLWEALQSSKSVKDAEFVCTLMIMQMLCKDQIF